MSEEKLRAAIEEVRAELAQAKGLDAESRRSLKQLADDLEARRAESMRGELGDWARKLEASHPSLATTLENLIDTLAFFNL
jgi:hypothetical protein